MGQELLLKEMRDLLPKGNPFPSLAHGTKPSLSQLCHPAVFLLGGGAGEMQVQSCGSALLPPGGFGFTYKPADMHLASAPGQGSEGKREA